jgi:hypothetical protein
MPPLGAYVWIRFIRLLAILTALVKRSEALKGSDSEDYA